MCFVFFLRRCFRSDFLFLIFGSLFLLTASTRGIPQRTLILFLIARDSFAGVRSELFCLNKTSKSMLGD